jgi:hypothetical protein
MHQSDKQGAPPKAMLMQVRALLMRDRFSHVAVDMDVFGAIATSMQMEMYAIAPQSPQYVCADANQHDTDRSLQRACKMFGDRLIYQDRGTGKNKERQRVAEPPCQPVLDDITDVGSAGGDARHSCDMVGFKRMLYSEQKAEPQNSEHVLPDYI